jgi:hypothetical protein
MKTLVPRIIGQTAAAQKKKGPPREQREWDEATSLADLVQKQAPAVVAAYRRLFEFLSSRSTQVVYGKGRSYGTVNFYHSDDREQQLFGLATNGRVGINFAPRSASPFADEQKRRELAQKLNLVPGISLPFTLNPSFLLGPVVEQNGLETLLSVMEWAIGEMQRVG